MSKDTLTIDAWIKAAFRALTIGGPQAIRAEAIARDLKVSKGSFYWHFANVGALKTQMLAHWKQEATQSIITVLEEASVSSADRLRRLVDVATDDANAEYGGVMAEAAIRDWARYDASAAQTVSAVDVQRLGYLEALFVQSGQTQSMSRANAAIFYGALIGLSSLSDNDMVDLNGDLAALLDLLLCED